MMILDIIYINYTYISLGQHHIQSSAGLDHKQES
jgi:hypothetical protein